MKKNINEVAEAIAKEISKYPANAPADHGTLHRALELTKRESEARQMAGWFLRKVEKIDPDESKETKVEFTKLLNELIDLSIKITGK